MFSLPYTPGLFDYLKLKPDYIPKINDIYFSDGIFPSARDIKFDDTYWDELLKIKNEFSIKLHYIINPSFYTNNVYLKDGLDDYVAKLRIIADKGVDILTFNNTILLRLDYFMNQIREMFPIIKNSVNNKVKTFHDVVRYHTYFNITHIMLDRSINRNFDELEKISAYAKEHKLTLTVLVNEGCIPDCPFKVDCDHMIHNYPTNTIEEKDVLYHAHDMLTCNHLYKSFPYDFLKSPFIMPNTLNLYSNHIDIFKISGRMIDIFVLGEIIESYLEGTGKKKLFYHFSTEIDKSFNLISFNDLYFEGFAEKTKNCKNICSECDYCENIYTKIIKTK